MRDEKKKRNLKISIIVCGIFLVGLAIYFTWAEVIKRGSLTIFEIKVNNLTCVNTEQINNYLNSLNLHYFSFRQDDFDRSIKKKFFCIGKTISKLSYPDTLGLEVWGREGAFAAREVKTSLDLNPVVDLPDILPEATESTKEAVKLKTINQILSDVKQSSESGVFLVDKEGVIFEQNPDEIKFPMLSLLGYKLEIGHQIPGGIIEKIGIILAKLKEIGTPADNIVIIGTKLVIDSKPRIIFSLNKRLDYQTASLQLILAQAKMNSDPKSQENSIESIDLRFDKPVVVYKKK